MTMHYVLLQPPRPLSELGCWESQLREFTHIVGFSGLGHFFLHNQDSKEFAVCYPFRQAYKSYGPFETVADFEAAILMDEGFIQYVLKPNHQAEIRSLLGPLADEEVYIPEPYPFLGGDEDPESYGKGNFWVFAEIVGICHGFDSTG